MPLRLLGCDREEAGRLLESALRADPFDGRIQDYLSVLRMQKGRLYEAALAFESARKLMLGHPDPRLNLALTLDRAGRLDEAPATYTSAVAMYPGHIPAMQALARLQLRSGKRDERTPSLLD